MKKFMIAAALVVSMAFAAPVMADTTITTGGKSGTYIKVGNNLKGMLSDGATVIKSKGGVENLDRLMKDEAQLGMTQMDTYAWYLSKHPDAANELEILGTMYQECAYLAVNKNGKVLNEDDLQSKGEKTIAIGKKGSGSVTTWDYMQTLEPKYKNTAISLSGGTRALGKLAAGQLDAVMWTTKPNLSGKMAQTVLKSDDLLLVGFHDKDLNDNLKSTGKPVYTFKKIETEKGFFNDSEITTTCMDSVIVGRQDVDEEILEEVADALLNYKSTLLK